MRNSLLTLVLHEDDLAATALGAIFLADADTMLEGRDLLGPETEAVAGMGLCHIGNLKAAQTVITIPVEGP